MTAGHRPPSSPRGFSGFCFASSERREGFKEFKSSKVQEDQLRPIRTKKKK